MEIDNKMLSFPENGIVKVLQPIHLEFYGEYELEQNNIKTRRRHKNPQKEWYEYLNGSIKNDTIYYTEKYDGSNRYKFNKKALGKTLKANIKESYQPNLIAVKNSTKAGNLYYEITGEFRIDQ